jgi:uncharacterized phiE125 gp8 family phage protein
MAALPISLLKSMLRVDFPDDDAVLSFYLDAAQQFAERHTRRLLTQQTKTKIMRRWFDEVPLPFPPFDSISAITYRDTAGATQTLTTANYNIEQDNALAVVRFLGDLPELNEDKPLVSIAWVCGYATGAIPADLQLAVCRLAGGYYVNPESISMLNLSSVPFGVRATLDNYQVPTLSPEAPE